MNIKNIVQKALENREKRGWKKLYWCIDLHSTIIDPTYDVNHVPERMFRFAPHVLRMLTMRPDMCIILYTSTSEESLSGVFEMFKENGITIDYLNKNPECESRGYADFSTKFYYDIVLDDKAGFEESDWKTIYDLLLKEMKILIRNGVGNPPIEDHLCLHPGVFKGERSLYLVDHDPINFWKRGATINDDDIVSYYIGRCGLL